MLLNRLPKAVTDREELNHRIILDMYPQIYSMLLRAYQAGAVDGMKESARVINLGGDLPDVELLKRDKQINVAFADGKGVPPFKVQKIGQVNKVAKSDSTVLVTEGLYGYC